MMTRTLSVLGSTGSIGTADLGGGRRPAAIRVAALTAHRNVGPAGAAVPERFHPDPGSVLADPTAAAALRIPAV